MRQDHHTPAAPERGRIVGALLAVLIMIPIAAYVVTEVLRGSPAPDAMPPVVASPAPTVAPSPAPPPVAGQGPRARLAWASVRAIVAAQCATCHVQQRLGGLNLGSYQGLVTGGAVVPGPVFKAGDHVHSTLWRIVRPTGPWPGGNRMPLGGPYLSDDQIRTIAAWIDQGAKNT